MVKIKVKYKKLTMNIKGVKVKVPLPSVNEESDLKEVNKFLQINKNQKKIIKKISNLNFIK